jgi:hypothetical protein
MVHPDGRSFHHHYQLLNEDPSSQTAVVNLLFTNGDSRSEADVISEDGRTLTIGTSITGHYSTEKLQRVDNATVPPKSYYMAGVNGTPVRPELATPVRPSWNPSAKASPDRMVARQRGAGRIVSYIIGLPLTAISILLVVALMYHSDLSWPRILAHWTIAAIGGLAGLFLLHAPIGAGILELSVGLTMLPQALFPKSSFD